MQVCGSRIKGPVSVGWWMLWVCGAVAGIPLAQGDPCPPQAAVGDFDRDADLDLTDLARLQQCFTGPGGTMSGACVVFDADHDGDVDLSDFPPVPAGMTGPGVPAALSVPQPGSARPWEGEMGVGPSGVVNLRHGNLLTMLPVVSWGGRGPGLAVGLYHGAAGVGLDSSFGGGFSLGPGWTVAYGGYVTLNGNIATVVDDDGTRTTYTWDGQQYVAPAGVYHRLERVGYGGGTCPPDCGWRLTYPDQTYREYDAAGRLAKEVDASENALLVVRDAQQRIDYLQDASGRTVQYDFDAQGRLTRFHDPGVNRSWALVYNVGGRLSELRDPLYNAQQPTKHVWKFTCDTAGRIVTLWDKEGNAFAYEYDAAGRLTRAVDPAPLNTHSQYWEYAAYSVPDPQGGPVCQYRRTAYTDRRGSAWTVWFNGTDDLVAWVDPLGARVSLTRDAAHQVVRYTDPLGRWWDYTYDARGNVTDVVDQHGRGANWTYDGLNNLLSYTDALGNTWTLDYTDPDNPTAVTGVALPPAPESGDPNPRVIAVSYFDAAYTPPGLSRGTWNGLVNTVTDPLGVPTRFEYDRWGQPSRYLEGAELLRGGERPTVLQPVTMEMHNDQGGRTTSGGPVGDDGECDCGQTCYNANNSATCQWCPKYVAPKSGAFKPTGDFFAGYDGMDRLLWVNKTMYYDPVHPQVGRTRDLSLGYDVLGRVTATTETTNESGTAVTRMFTLSYMDGTGVYEVLGPDGVVTRAELDAAGRAARVEQDGVWASFAYYPDGLPRRVDRSNGTWTEYLYDFQNLQMDMEHYGTNGALLLGLEYQFTANGLVQSIGETNANGPMAVTTFWHDARGQVYREVRIPTTPYMFSHDITYTYDANGNRRTAHEVYTAEGWPATERTTTYTYDLDAPATYGTKANRLMSTTTTGWPSGTRTYAYDELGNVKAIVDSVAGYTPFYYDKMGRV